MGINNSEKLDFISRALVLGTALLFGIAIFSMGQLVKLQKEGFQQKVDALQANEGEVLAFELRWFAFRAADERKFNGVWKVVWHESKRKSLNIVGQLIETAEAGEEKSSMIEAENALKSFIDLFEKRLLPQLEKDASLHEISATESLLAAQAEMLSTRMNKHMMLLQERAGKVDAAYESKFSETIWLVCGVVLLTLGFCVQFILKTRAYAKTVCETECHLKHLKS